MGDLILAGVALAFIALVLDGLRSRHTPTPEELKRAEDTALRQWEQRYEPPDWV